MPSNINIQNNVQELSLSNSDPDGLSTDYYGYEEETAKELEETEYLWFNRNDGITDGTTYKFITTFPFANYSFTIDIHLTGTALSSYYKIKVTAESSDDEQDTGWMHDTGTKKFKIKVPVEGGGTLSYEVLADRFLNGTFDDVTVTISPSSQDPPSTGEQLLCAQSSAGKGDLKAPSGFEGVS